MYIYIYISIHVCKNYLQTHVVIYIYKGLVPLTPGSDVQYFKYYIYIYSLFNFDVFDTNIFECHPDLMDTLQFVYDPAEDRLQCKGRTARPCI